MHQTKNISLTFPFRWRVPTAYSGPSSGSHRIQQQQLYLGRYHNKTGDSPEAHHKQDFKKTQNKNFYKIKWK